MLDLALSGVKGLNSGQKLSRGHCFAAPQNMGTTVLSEGPPKGKQCPRIYQRFVLVYDNVAQLNSQSAS